VDQPQIIGITNFIEKQQNSNTGSKSNKTSVLNSVCSHPSAHFTHNTEHATEDDCQRKEHGKRISATLTKEAQTQTL
jgi:hypothetical protein